MMDLFTKVVLAGAVLFAFAWVVVSQRRFFKELSDAYLRLTHLQRVLVLVAVAICTVHAQKPNTNNVQNGEAVSSPLVTNLTTSSFLDGPRCSFLISGQETASPLSVTDVERGYRLESVTLNPDVCYTMPDGAAVVGTWHLTGAYEDVVRIGIREQGLGISGWSFPLGTHLCDHLWAYTWGKARPQLKNFSNEIAAVGAPMSAIPDVSRFWTAATTNGSRLLTWENFVEGRVGEAVVVFGQAAGKPLSPYLSAQIELFPNGDFIARSNEVESVYRRVIAPNPIGPDNPEDPDNPLMPIHPYGPVQDLSVIGESNAYCWVDIVVSQADAWVQFVGDGPSDLADPSFAAKAGETNHVVILIGKTYKVTCDVPFEVVGKSCGAIDEWWEDERTLWLNWPVEIWAQGDDEDMPLLLFAASFASPRGSGFTMFVSPSGLGGSFNWTNSCCSVSGSGYYFTYNCNGDCSCHGCAATGYFSYEGYRLPAWGGSCGCSGEDDDDLDDDDPNDPPAPVGVSVSFSKKVVFLEDAYANTTNDVVTWHSEITELHCSAFGGDKGGFVMFSISGDDNLIQHEGQQFPISRSLQPYETFCFTNVYRAVSASTRAEEIEVTGDFAENDTDWTDNSTDKATAVKIEIKAQVVAPENECLTRHKFGVLELVDCLATPTVSGLMWRCAPGGQVSGSTARTVYSCPIHSQYNGVWIEGLGASYTPTTTVVQPDGVIVRDVGFQDKGLGSGHAGGILLTMTLHASPLDVSFLRTMMEEVPDVGGDKDGYFRDTSFMSDWLHGEDQGAGVWGAVIGDNEFLSDKAGFKRELYQLDDDGFVSSVGTNGWVAGALSWEVPCGWSDANVQKGDEPYGRFANSATQVMTIDANGNCQVIKHANSVIRTITGQKYLNGVLQ